MAEINLTSNNLKRIIGVGVNFPFMFSGRGGVLMSGGDKDEESVERIRQSLRIILGTKLGERVIRRKFGSELNNLLFEGMDEILVARLRQFIHEGILAFERRILLRAISIISTDTNTGRIDVNVEFVIVRTQQVGNLVYPLYVSENTSLV